MSHGILKGGRGKNREGCRKNIFWGETHPINLLRWSLLFVQSNWFLEAWGKKYIDDTDTFFSYKNYMRWKIKGKTCKFFSVIIRCFCQMFLKINIKLQHVHFSFNKKQPQRNNWPDAWILHNLLIVLCLQYWSAPHCSGRGGFEKTKHQAHL